MERALLILSCIALFLSSLIELEKREAIKNGTRKNDLRKRK